MLVIAPVAAFFCLFLPVYIGMLTSLHLIYQPEDQAANPVSEMLYDVTQVTKSYFALLEYWQDYGAYLSFTDFILPLLVPPIIGGVIGVGFLYYFIRYCLNIFRV